MVIERKLRGKRIENSEAIKPIVVIVSDDSCGLQIPGWKSTKLGKHYALVDEIDETMVCHLGLYQSSSE